MEAGKAPRRYGRQAGGERILPELQWNGGGLGPPVRTWPPSRNWRPHCREYRPWAVTANRTEEPRMSRVEPGQAIAHVRGRGGPRCEDPKDRRRREARRGRRHGPSGRGTGGAHRAAGVGSGAIGRTPTASIPISGRGPYPRDRGGAVVVGGKLGTRRHAGLAGLGRTPTGPTGSGLRRMRDAHDPEGARGVVGHSRPRTFPGRWARSRTLTRPGRANT